MSTTLICHVTLSQKRVSPQVLTIALSKAEQRFGVLASGNFGSLSHTLCRYSGASGKVATVDRGVIVMGPIEGTTIGGWRTVRVSAFSVALLVGGLLLSACGSGRSVEAFCDTYWSEKEAYLAKYDKAASDLDAAGQQDALAGLLGGTAMMAQSLGDVVVMFDKLDKVAPDDIQPDVAVIRDSMQSQMDSASDMVSNPFGALIGGLFQGLTTGGSWQRVNDYVVVQCGESAGSTTG